MWYLRIPKERIAVLIGTEGRTKRRIEDRAGVVLDIDSSTGEVNIRTEGAEPVLALKVRDVVKAIGRGFSPRRAEVLFSDEAYFDILDIRDYAGKNPKRVKQIRGRIIGRNGRTREMIEEYTGAELSIYGNTVAMIGPLEAVDISKHAVDMILSGSKHGSVYRYLDRKQKAHRKKEFQELIAG
jgi:ribosomal RNA assembly protein